MILVIGGVAAGKRAFVREALGVTGQNAVLDAQELVREESIEALLPRLLAAPVVVCNEVGSGVVPMDPAEREWRERVGRLCCALAQEASAVVRVCCGLPTVLKGEL